MLMWLSWKETNEHLEMELTVELKTLYVSILRNIEHICQNRSSARRFFSFEFFLRLEKIVYYICIIYKYIKIAY